MPPLNLMVPNTRRHTSLWQLVSLGMVAVLALAVFVQPCAGMSVQENTDPLFYLMKAYEKLRPKVGSMAGRPTAAALADSDRTGHSRVHTQPEDLRDGPPLVRATRAAIPAFAVAEGPLGGGSSRGAAGGRIFPFVSSRHQPGAAMSFIAKEFAPVSYKRRTLSRFPCDTAAMAWCENGGDGLHMYREAATGRRVCTCSCPVPYYGPRCSRINMYAA